MSAKTLEKRHENLFELLDKNQDGVIEQADFDAVLHVGVNDLGLQPGSQQWLQLIPLAHNMWRQMPGRTDKNGVKKVTKSEWLAAARKPEFVEQAILPVALAGFELADRDGDGMISEQELQLEYHCFGMSEGEVREAFQKLDRDGDGYVSKDEYSQAIRDLYLNEDSATAGALLAGRL